MMEQPPRMGDPAAPYIVASQSYGIASMAQYQAVPQPQFAPPLPPSSTLQQAQVISNTYPKISSNQLLPPIPYDPQFQASSSIHQQQQPGPIWYGPPQYSAHQSYHTSSNSDQPPRSMQYNQSASIPTPNNNSAYHQHDPQSAYPASPPTQGRDTYPPDYVRASIDFAPTWSTQIVPYGAVKLQNSHLTYGGYPVAPSPSLHDPGNPASLTPLSTAASIKAVLQTTGSVLSYLRDVKEYWGDCKTLISELTSIRGMLDTLLDTFQSMDGLGEWAGTIQALGEQLGPLVLLRTILKNLLDQLLRSTSAPSHVKFTKSLPWPFEFKEMKNILKSIETEKSLLLMAVQNDVLFLCEVYLRKRSPGLPGGGGDGAPQPPVVEPQTSTLQSEPNVDNLTSLFSQTSIHTKPATTTVTTVVQRLDLAPQDGVEKVIRNVLIQDLTRGQKNEMICPNHPCFDRSREFARKWSIPPTATDNHVKLACGNRRYPVLMLLNPSDHDNLSFDAMVQRCETLKWIQRVFMEMCLTLAEVIILDICPLLSDRRIKSMNEYQRNDAMNEAFQLTWEMLRMIRPNIIVSCQCSTATSEKWEGVRHDISWKLCSSTSLARRGDVIETEIEGHATHVVQAYHPSGFLRFSDHHDQSGESLKRLLSRIYSPCVIWYVDPPFSPL